MQVLGRQWPVAQRNLKPEILRQIGQRRAALGAHLVDDVVQLQHHAFGHLPRDTGKMAVDEDKPDNQLQADHRHDQYKKCSEKQPFGQIIFKTMLCHRPAIIRQSAAGKRG